MYRLRLDRRFVVAPLLAVVLVCAGSGLQGQSSPQRNPYDAQLRALQREFRGTEAAPRQAVLLAEAGELRDYLDDRAGLRQWLAQVAGDGRLHSLVRDEAAMLLGRLQMQEGRLETADAAFSALGFVRSWATVGPFLTSAPGTDELDAPLGPEQGWNSRETYRDAAGRERAWRPVPQPGPQPVLDLVHLHSHEGAAVAFLTSAVYAESAQPVALRFGADGALALWVNGRRIFRHREQSSFAPDQHAAGVRLQAGWNTLVVKLAHRGAGPWRFALRLTRPMGGGVTLPQRAEAGLDSEPVPAAGGGIAVADLLSMAAAAAKAASQSAPAHETLGKLAQRRGFASALSHLEQAARLAPTAARWRSVAQACSLDACRLSALTSALRLVPQDAEAHLALSDYYLQRRQPAKALELLRTAVRLAPADFVVRMRLAELELGVAEAPSALAALERDFPAPLWLQRRLAAAYERTGQIARALPLAESALRHNFDGVEERALLERLYQRRRDAAALLALYEDALRLAPADINARARIAELQAGAGDLASAQRTLRAALELNPGHPGLQRQMGDLLAAAGRPRDAHRQLAHTLAENPQLTELRHRLQAEPLPASLRRALRDEESEHIAEAARLAALAHRGQRPRGRAIALADIRVQRVFPGGLNVLRVQQVLHIGSAAGAREFARRSVQYSPETQDLQILSARIHKPDRSTVEAVPAGESAVHDTSAGLFYDVRARNLRFPGLAPGDVLELDYRIAPRTRLNPHGDYFGDLVMFGSSLPRRLQRYVLITPAARDYHIVEERMPVAARNELRNGRRIRTWEMRNVRAIPFETRGPALSELAPYVLVSSFHSWDDLGRWYAALIRPQLALDAALRETVARLTEGTRTDSEKIYAVHQFVLRNTQYLGLEFGIHSYKPYPVSQVLARRFGDCKDKSALMVAMLRAAGIEAEIALVRTRRAGDIGEGAPSIHVFNHAIVYIPEHELWLDGTAEYAGSRELPRDNGGALALTIALDGASQLRRIPMHRPEDNYTRRAVRAQVGDDGVIRFDGLVYTRGEDAPGLRRQYEAPDRQVEVLRSRLAAVVPRIRVEDVRVDGAHDLERNVSVEFRGALHTFAGRRRLALEASWMPRSFVEKLAALETRTQDLLLPSPWSSDEELVFALPAGAVVTSVPRDVFLETPFGTASLRFEQRPGEVVVRNSVEFRAVRVSPAEYAEFRRFCQDMERAFRGRVEVLLPHPPAAAIAQAHQDEHSPELVDSAHHEATEDQP